MTPCRACAHGRLVASVWLAGVLASALLAIVLIGCCALPFHDVAHRWVPCHLAQAAVAPPADGPREDDRAPVAPAPRKRETPDPQRIVDKLDPRTAAVSATLSARVPSQPGGDPTARSRRTQGAVRCDVDVGVRLALLDTLRI
jgi:hypothetical protein